jgi:4-amino-4-deoxy-L-arabinose transferase-like glycosyltransferase
MYLTVPFVGLLGPADLAVRLPVALIGSLSIILIYFLAKTLFIATPRTKHLALLSALLLALTPWHIHFSRAAFEVVPLIFLIMLGTLLFLRGKHFASLFPFILTFYTYSTAMVFTPLFVLALLFVERPKLNLKKNWYRLVFPLILFSPIVFSVLFGHAGGRFNLVSIFGDPKIIEPVILQRTDPWVKQSFGESLFHNKYLAITQAFANNYLTAFSPQFLFISGDPFFRHSISMVGELLIVTLPLLMAGIFFIFKNISQKENKILLLWLLLAPVSSSLTTNGGTHATRLFLMLPPLILISSLGGIYLLNLFGKKLVKPAIIIFLTLLVVSFAGYFHRYSTHYRYESASLWEYGFENIFTELRPLTSQYDKVYINNTYQPSLLLFLFYTQYPPKDFQKNFVTDKVDTYQTSSFHGFVFDKKYYFGESPNVDELKVLLTDKDLYLAVQGREGQGDWDWSKDPLENTKVLTTQKNIFGQPLFYILAGTKPYNIK